MNRKLTTLIVIALVLVTAVVMLKTTAASTDLLWRISNQGQWLLPLIIVSALLDSINPCAFSVLLLTIAFLLSIGQSRANIVRISTAYVIGIFLAYMLIGLGLLQVLHLFNTPHVIGNIGAWLLIALAGVSIIGEFFPSFPIKLRIPQAAHSKMATLLGAATLPTAFALGALVGLCEFPCTGGPYLTALGLLHDQATYLVGAGYLVLYNVLFVTPLVIVLMIASDRAVLERVQAWRHSNIRSMRLWSAAAMALLGALILLL